MFEAKISIEKGEYSKEFHIKEDELEAFTSSVYSAAGDLYTHIAESFSKDVIITKHDQIKLNGDWKMTIQLPSYRYDEIHSTSKTSPLEYLTLIPMYLNSSFSAFLSSAYQMASYDENTDLWLKKLAEQTFYIEDDYRGSPMDSMENPQEALGLARIVTEEASNEELLKNIKKWGKISRGVDERERRERIKKYKSLELKQNDKISQAKPNFIKKIFHFSRS